MRACYNKSSAEYGLQGRSATSRKKGGMPTEVKDTLTLMIGFGALIIALLTLVVAIVVALIHKK